MSSSTCNSCNVTFSLEDAKAHYSTPFHNANVKRRLADLAPLTLAAFQRASAAEAAAAAARAAAEEAVLYICDACHKTFSSEGQFRAHNTSGRHRERVRELLAARAGAGGGGGGGVAGAGATDAAPAAGAEQEEKEEKEETLEVGATHCVFCWAAADSLEANFLHMRSAHSFSLPDAEFCVDPAGLVERLHEMVIEGGRCLLCPPPRRFASPRDAQAHMADKAHCRMLYADESHFEEFEEFYDYEGYEPASPPVMAADGTLVLPGGRFAYPKELARVFKQYHAPPDERASVKTAMARLTDAYAGGGGGGGSGLGRAAALAAAAARRAGTRGNNTDANAQLREQASQSHFQLQIGMQMNQIRRRYFRVQTTMTGRTN
jgi:hypothetical protein